MKQKKNNIYSLIAFVLALLIVAGAATSAMAAGNEKPKINAMTRNLYLGADIFKVVNAAQADPATIPFVVAEIYQTMLYTNFWARAEAIADEIEENNPHVVGLQEVSTFYKQTPGDFMLGNPVQASEVVIDFYTVLNAALLARGLEYDSFVVSNADVELPMVDSDAGPPYYLSDVRMVDHDMILVRKGVPSQEVALPSNNFQAKLSMDLGGVPVEFTRGFLVVDVDVKGDMFRFVNTHLEVRSAPASVFRVIQSFQMQELLGTLAYISYFDLKPIVMVGDFNSSAEDVPGTGYVPGIGWVPYTPPYMQAVGSGYLDSWLLQKKYDAGYTSGFDEYVSDPTEELTTRIDLVFVGLNGLSIDKVKCDVVGDRVSDMVPNLPYFPDQYLWPSDHAGVVAKLKFLR